jgi:hypothetical protein
MRVLARPAALSWLLSLGALLLFPALGSERWLPGRTLVLVALLLLAGLALLLRALLERSGRAGAGLLAAGALLVLAGVGLDGVLGRQGTLRLGVGRTAGNFDETGPGGRSLGLRPLGFQVGAVAATADGATLLLPSGRVELTRRRAVAFGGFRLADPRVAPTGEAALLRIAASDGTKTEVADLTPDGAVRMGDLLVSLEQYFPDFALDDQQRPFSRSLEPRNPAALLTVSRGGQSYRAFVLQSMPGVHRVQALDLAFTLLSVEPERVVTIAVERQPFAPLALLGVLLLIAGVTLSVRPAPEAEGVSADTMAGTGTGPLVAGTGLLATLLLVDFGHLLGWAFGLAGPAGRLPLPGAGIPLGLALLASLAGVLLLAGARLAPGVRVGRLGRGLLVAAVVGASAGLVLSAVRVVASGFGLAAALPVVGIALAVLVLAVALRPLEAGLPLVGPATGLLLAAALGVALGSTLRHGSYATPLVAAVGATALLGLSACQRTGLAAWRRLLLLLAVLALFVRPI